MLNRRQFLKQAALIAGVTLFPYGCAETKREIYPDANVILISIDTLRADHLGCYGYKQNTTPNIDKFSLDSMLFKDTIAQAPSTTPSHASMFTSLIPEHHNASYSRETPISFYSPTLAEILNLGGFNTISFNGGGQIDNAFGFGRGFDFYSSYTDVKWKWDEEVGKLTNKTKEWAGSVNKAKEWISSNKEKKFFMFLHTYDVHAPYSPEKEEYLRLFEGDYSGKLPNYLEPDYLQELDREGKLTEEDKQHVRNIYDTEIYGMDESFGDLINFLQEEGLYDNTMIVFTSDHGEEFSEHGTIATHSHTLYDELLKVPLIIKFPYSSNSSKIIEDQVRSIDIAPTILETLGIPVPSTFDGVDLVDWFDKAHEEELYAVSQRYVSHDDNNVNTDKSIRTKKWKLNKGELYNLELDSQEQFPCSLESSHENKKKKGFLERRLDEILKERPSGFGGEKAEIRKELREQLKALGYVD